MFVSVEALRKANEKDCPCSSSLLLTFGNIENENLKHRYFKGELDSHGDKGGTTSRENETIPHYILGSRDGSVGRGT